MHLVYRAYSAAVLQLREFSDRRGLLGEQAQQIFIRHKELAMGWLIFKYATTAFLVVLISEVAKRSDRLGSFIASLPTITVLTLLWLYFEKQPAEKLTNHAYYTFWYVIPTLPMFFLFPWLFGKFGFWGAIGASVLVTVGCFAVVALLARMFDVDLLG